MSLTPDISITPSADVTMQNGKATLTFTENLPNTNAWRWTLGDGFVKMGRTITHDYTSHGAYNMRLLVRDAYCTVEVSRLVTIRPQLVSRDGLIEELGVVLYPNPASDRLVLELEQSAGLRQVTLVLLDVAGKLVAQQIYDVATDRQMILPVAGLSAGTYYLQVETEKGTFGQRVLIQR
jgi:hypothetical protein